MTMLLYSVFHPTIDYSFLHSAAFFFSLLFRRLLWQCLQGHASWNRAGHRSQGDRSDFGQRLLAAGGLHRCPTHSRWEAQGSEVNLLLSWAVPQVQLENEIDLMRSLRWKQDAQHLFAQGTHTLCPTTAVIGRTTICTWNFKREVPLWRSRQMYLEYMPGGSLSQAEASLS